MMDNIIAMHFLEDQRLLMIIQDGRYMIYHPKSGELSNVMFIADPGEFVSDEVIAAKGVRNCLVYVKRSLKVYLKELTGNRENILLYQPENKYIVSENEIAHLSVFASESDPNAGIDVFLPMTSGGVLRIHHGAQPKIDRLLTTVSEPVMRTSVSPSGDNLAVLTRSGMLYVVYLKNASGKHWKKQLEIDEGEISKLQKLEWVAYFAVALVFLKNIKLACCGMDSRYFELRDIVSSSQRTNYIITRSEIDGLRVIRVFENYHKQHCSIVRRLPQAYISARLSFSTQSSPGKLLLDLYMATLHGNPLEEDDDIRQFKPQLVDAVTELIECGCFELDAVDHGVNVGQTGRVPESCCVWQEVSHQR